MTASNLADVGPGTSVGAWLAAGAALPATSAAGGPAEPPREIGVEHGVEALEWVLEARQPLSPLLLVRYNLEVHLKKLQKQF